jgi:iron complex transport system substrate-binding protein
MAFLPDGAIRDSAGRMLDVKAPYTRVISLYSAHTENLLSLGAGEHLAGVAKSDTRLAGAKDKPVFAASDGIERFLAAKPGLVLVRPMLDRGYAPLMEEFARFGVPVVSLQPNSVGEMLVYWRILGRLTGRDSEAEDMVRRFEAGCAAARDISSRAFPRKTVYMDAVHDKHKTFLPGSVTLFALECAGGINAAADAEQVRDTNIAYYGKERLLARAEEIDVILAQTGTMNRPTVEGILAEPGYSVIKAVRENQVYLVKEELVSRPTLRLLEGIWEIGHVLYPELFDAAARTRIRGADGTESGNGR